MSEIRLLDQATIDKIAAGEVVERPSSVVKELTENAIDAGAGAITIETENGGTSLIRITDNGSGVEKDMVRKAFLRHSTSKLRQISDLDSLHTLGFRGEALSSIAAVARVEFLTCTKGSFLGTSYRIEGGIEKGMEEAGLPQGTTVLVKDLFYNVPARQKFLKSPQTEGNYIASLVQEISLSHPEISFQLIQNHKVRFQTSGSGKLKDVVYQIYGAEVAKKIIPVDLSDENGRLHGFLGKPELSRNSRKFESFFVNGRFVQDKILQKAVEEGYKSFLMQHQFPFVLLFLDLDGKLVDVNVHPAKALVRFSYEEEVFRKVSGAVKETVANEELIPQVPLEKKKGKEEGAVYSPKGKIKPPVVKKGQRMPEPFESGRKPAGNDLETGRIPAGNDLETGRIPAGNDLEAGGIPAGNDLEAGGIPAENDLETGGRLADSRMPAPAYSSLSNKDMKTTAPSAVNDTVPYDSAFSKSPGTSSSKGSYQQMELPIVKTSRSRFRLVGEVFDTYWILEYDGKLYMVDQHAAHEKVNYERLVRKFREKTVTVQQLMPPVIVTLTPQEQQVVEQYHDIFRQCGFEIESFGGKEYSISGVPEDLYGMDEKEFFESVLDEMQDIPGGMEDPDAVLHRLATAACKMSVKGADVISFQEAEELLKELFACENPYHCPHGRPTMISLTRQDLEKMFKRIVS